MKGGRDNSRTQQSNRNRNRNRNNNENTLNNNITEIIRPIRRTNNRNTENTENTENTVIRRNTNVDNNMRNVRTRSNSRTRTRSNSRTRSRTNTGSNSRSRTNTGSSSRSSTGSNSSGRTQIYGDRNYCSICFGRLTSRSRRILECRHAFHTRCINRYCRTVSNCRCPICRTPITN